MIKIKKTTPLTTDTISLLAKVTVSLGLAVVVIYLFRIKHFPTSIAIGDSFIFATSSFSFAIIYLLLSIPIVVTAHFAARFFLGIFNRIANKELFLRKTISTFASHSLAFSPYFLLLLTNSYFLYDYIGDISTIFLVMFILFIILLHKTNTNMENKHIFCVLILLLPALVSLRLTGYIIDRSMELTGIRKDNVTFHLDERTRESICKIDSNISCNENTFFGKILFKMGNEYVIELSGKKFVIYPDSIAFLYE
ncbi:hypothetical protein dsat_0256 [Alkalidesulfovibrio alkalitolerans DSM 16529]|uniref:Uncharacterized protein n=1 Tax=Alkalidesulfovibrio alkalitolerans DSM 16529 TaxID=1121439 RepID=S7T8L1_9BACT|nr:hypothetical protein [Alkalidesulfovibrio alkalitolerans]EPR32815.1 hypothetical protein dsat_0256 [Alkalidesulfovibrio alkalitolerans DSM 16529]